MIRARRGYAHDLGNKQVVVCLWLVQDAPHWYFHYRAFERQINCAHLTGQFTCVWMECLVWFNCVLVWFNCVPSTDQLCTPDWAAFSYKPRFLLTGETGTYCWFLPIHLLQLTTINQECNDLRSSLASTKGHKFQRGFRWFLPPPNWCYQCRPFPDTSEPFLGSADWTRTYLHQCSQQGINRLAQKPRRPPYFQTVPKQNQMSMHWCATNIAD